MTREEASIIIGNIPINSDTMDDCYSITEYQEAKAMAIKALGQEPCEEEYIKVPKNALKYRTAGMVAYNAEWLKNHFDIERAVICGEQEPILDKIRSEIEDAAERFNMRPEISYDTAYSDGLYRALSIIDKYREPQE